MDKQYAANFPSTSSSALRFHMSCTTVTDGWREGSENERKASGKGGHEGKDCLEKPGQGG
jgi:hypothetical protein